LGNTTTIEDRHAVRDGHRLFLIVRDIDERLAELALDALELDPSLLPQSRIERGDWVVHQVGGGIAHERAGDRDPLPLAAGQLRWRLVKDMPDMKLGGDLGHSFFDCGFGDFSLDQREPHVLLRRHVRKKRKILKDHRDIAIGGRHPIDLAPPDQDVPRVGRLSPRMSRRIVDFPDSGGPKKQKNSLSLIENDALSTAIICP
jgi:hypothetical protein